MLFHPSTQFPFMSTLKNLQASVHFGIAGPLIVVKADANQGSSTEKVDLRPASSPGFNPTILLLQLVNANDEMENWQEVSYSENLSDENKYHKVQVINHGEVDVAFASGARAAAD